MNTLIAKVSRGGILERRPSTERFTGSGLKRRFSKLVAKSISSSKTTNRTSSIESTVEDLENCYTVVEGDSSAFLYTPTTSTRNDVENDSLYSLSKANCTVDNFASSIYIRMSDICSNDGTDEVDFDIKNLRCIEISYVAFPLSKLRDILDFVYVNQDDEGSLTSYPEFLRNHIFLDVENMPIWTEMANELLHRSVSGHIEEIFSHDYR
ncbi:hypothetical protein BGW36DRAFT_359679 [Talaromyces proteolyticus]|uniref:Uncharacterized protein n=1 Tax=Talaromyces proteolyticus TaxID=1131652 RepID=A0AAD4KRZ0_9EURO|nr:uncharacterized protein BGW36DRAFT_359679 [Talaromyces proteolyticus]KAH8697909.1 hypothetical protein BGW36DRAFT_359679 [Talaromyces proteolyticus]